MCTLTFVNYHTEIVILSANETAYLYISNIMCIMYHYVSSTDCACAYVVAQPYSYWLTIASIGKAPHRHLVNGQLNIDK